MDFLGGARRAGLVGCAAAIVSSGMLAGGGVELRVSNRTNATPSIASDGNAVAIVWGAALPDGATDVFVAVSADGGQTFSAPSRVNDVDGDARLSGEQPPRVAIRAAGPHPPSLSVVWTTKGSSGTKLVHARSADGGRTFEKAAAVPGADAPGNRGWENLAFERGAQAGGRPAYVVWLDHRELATQDGDVAASHHDHAAMQAGKPDGVAMAQKSKLFVASLDGSIAPHAVTGGVCYCCKTAIAVSPTGVVALAWRHVYPGNIRDIAFTQSRDGARTFAPPVRVSADKWQIEGCPDDGPAMAIDGAGRIHVVWPTLVTEAGTQTIALFYATSVDGARFTLRERVPTEGMPHHPQIAIGGDGAPVVAWDESAAGTRRAAIARATVDRAGVPHFSRIVLGNRAVYPVIAAVPTGVVVAWTSANDGASSIHVERR